MTDEASDSSRRLAFLNHGERISGMGSWEWTPDTGELLWSDNHFRLVSLAPDAIVPTPEFVIARTRADDRGLVEHTVRAMLTDEYAGDELEYRVVGADGEIRSLKMTVATLVHGERPMRRFVGSVQDVTAQRRVDRQLAAHVAVTQSLDDWRSLEHGAHGLLRRMASAMEMALAVLWVPDGSAFACRIVWHLPSPQLELVAKATLSWRPGIGAATLGRARTTRQPVISTEASQGSSGERAGAMRAAGLHGALAVPAVFVDETLAVLEFLSFEPVDPTPPLARALDGIGHEIGHFLSHRRGELSAPVLTRREQQYCNSQRGVTRRRRSRPSCT